MEAIQMEQTLDTILDAVRLDAISRLRNADSGLDKIIDAAKQIMKLADLARRNGLLILEDTVETIPSDYLRQLILLVVDGTFP